MSCTGPFVVIRMYEISELYTQMADTVFREHPDLHWIAEAGVTVGFMISDRKKKSKGKMVLGECILVKDPYKVFVPFDFLVVVYEQNTEMLTQRQLKILLYHELLHVGMDDTGDEPKYIVRPHDIEEFSEVVEQYGLDWSRR